MKIRITGGELKGRIILSPEMAGTHPMGSREKIALFNMLGSAITGVRVLDAYAGSGALGIEALSRGATGVVFVEKNPRVAKVIKQNLESLNLAKKAKIKVADAANLPYFAKFGTFGAILADPPYDGSLAAEAANLANFLAPGGILALSHPGVAPELPGLALLRSRAYARARLSIYAKPSTN